MKKRMYSVWIVLLIGMSLITVSAFGTVQEQEFQTLELMGVYESEEELRAAYPEHFPKVNHIQMKENAIHFTDADTGRILRQMPVRQFSMEFKTSLTETELRQAEKPIVSEMVDRYFSDDKSLLVVSEGTVQRRGLDDFAEGTFEITRNTLYNANGEIVTELPLEAGMIVVSPRTRDFVAYNWAEFGGPPSIYFYSSDGTLWQRQEIFEQAQVRYSQNGKLVQIHDNTNWTLDKPLAYS